MRRKARVDKAIEEMPVILLATKVDSVFQVKCKVAGAFDVIEKPVARETLREVCERALTLT
jgi:FixJ family two-component response regulator